MKIAVFVDKEGKVLPIHKTGIIKLFIYEEERWIDFKQIPFDLNESLSISEIQNRIRIMFQEIEDCEIFIAETIKEIISATFKNRGIKFWKHSGLFRSQHLDEIIKRSITIEENTMETNHANKESKDENTCAKVYEEEKTAIANHPCFDIEARHTHARVHLPVAPKCNIQCNYCNRKYDCVNESRPGVSSAVLSPYQAVEYLKVLNTKIKNLSVIGIAGPGDPFANPEETIETMRLIKKEFPDKLFCLSTNGLNLKPYINEIAELGVSHVTITINAIDPTITAKIYSWVRDGVNIYRGIEGATLMMNRQLECIPLLKAKGITVKINSVIVPGINDRHIPEVAKKVAELGADVMNCIPLVPTIDTGFVDVMEPDKGMIFKIRTQAKEYIPMMTHCSRCRADAAGLLGQDFTEAFGMLQEYALKPLHPHEERPYVAVATHDGILVNKHLGEATALYIYKQTPNGFHFMGERATPPAGKGDQRWLDLAKTLKDCRALFVSGVGENPMFLLQKSGLRVVQMTGLIDEGLEAIYQNKQIKTEMNADAFKCGGSCGGKTKGCA